MTVTLLGVDWEDPRAVALRASMDAEMQVRYTGSDLDPVAVATALAVDPADVVATVIAVHRDGSPVGHAAVRRLGNDWEIKRVVVDAAHRGSGIAGRLMTAVEGIAAGLGARRVILQTGDRQPEAVALYRRSGYSPIPIYPPYAGVVSISLCFEKRLGEKDPLSARS